VLPNLLATDRAFSRVECAADSLPASVPTAARGWLDQHYQPCWCGSRGTSYTILYDIYCLMLSRRLFGLWVAAIRSPPFVITASTLQLPQDHALASSFQRFPSPSGARGTKLRKLIDLGRYRCRFSASLDPMRGATAINRLLFDLSCLS
jgi:hypothetical protein